MTINLILLLFLLLSLAFDYTITLNKIVAVFLIISSGVLVWKSRKNIVLFVVFSFVFFVNYSISVGEFITTVITSCPLSEVKEPIFYGIALKTILVFIILLNVFFEKVFSKVTDTNFAFSDGEFITDDFVFIGILFMLLYIFFNGINQHDRTTYAVAITPIYEYSRTLFLIAFLFTGNKKSKKMILFLFMICFIVRDLYYGGRVTSLQILLLILILYYRVYLSPIKFLCLSIAGIILFVFVGAYRISYAFNFSVSSLIKAIFSESLFVLDTATYSFYASSTHVATAFLVDYNLKFKSFSAFLTSLFFKSRELADVTSLSNFYYRNVGGGIIVTHFYFWLGWVGVLCFSITIIFMLAYLINQKGKFAKILLISVLVTLPRWYLYGPIVFFKGGLIVPAIFYFVSNYIHNIITMNYVPTKEKFTIKLEF